MVEAIPKGPGYVSVGLGAIFLLLLGLLAMVTPSPHFLGMLAPYSLIIVIPALFARGTLGGTWIILGYIGTLIAPSAFVLVSRTIVKRGGGIPMASIVIFVVLVALSYALAAIDWNNTVRFTSIDRAIALAIQSLLPPVILVIIYIKSRSHLTVTRSIALHWFGLAWLTWSAFPWWGELL